MRTSLLYFSLALLLIGTGSCSRKCNNTIADLKIAIDGEMSTSAKYAASASQAAQEGLYGVEALFRAVLQAEAIHVENHRSVLASLGVKDYFSEVPIPEVKTTSENLQDAIEAETNEFTNMYPIFILDAEHEQVKNAQVSFELALAAEKKHAAIFRETLALLATPEAIASVYYICPKCGNIFPGSPAPECELCEGPAAEFVSVSAVAPNVAPAVPVAGNDGVTSSK